MCGRQAWQKLGAMPAEDAMQQYIDIVTDLYPTWAAGSALVRIFFFFFFGIPLHILAFYRIFCFLTLSWFIDSCLTRRAKVEEVMQ
jgi:hypothetical protein